MDRAKKSSMQRARNTSRFFLVLMVVLIGSLFLGCSPLDSPTASEGSGPSAETTVPAAPAGVSATAGDAQVVVKWAAVTDATSYKVFYKAGTTATSSDTQAATSMISGLTVTVTGLTNGTKYAFIVIATNADGDGAPSSSVTATPVATIIDETKKPQKPTNVVATPGTCQVTLAWPTVANATSYKIYYAIGSYAYTSDPQVPASMISGTTAIVTGLRNGIEYSFRLVASNAAGDSLPSDNVNATPVISFTQSGTWNLFLQDTRKARNAWAFASNSQAAYFLTDNFASSDGNSVFKFDGTNLTQIEHPGMILDTSSGALDNAGRFYFSGIERFVTPSANEYGIIPHMLDGSSISELGTPRTLFPPSAGSEHLGGISGIASTSDGKLFLAGEKYLSTNVLKVYNFASGAWNKIGEITYDSSQIKQINLVAVSETQVYVITTYSQTTTYYGMMQISLWNGSSFSTIASFRTYSLGFPSIVKTTDGFYMAVDFQDGGKDELRICKIAGSAFSWLQIDPDVRDDDFLDGCPAGYEFSLALYNGKLILMSRDDSGSVNGSHGESVVELTETDGILVGRFLGQRAFANGGGVHVFAIGNTLYCRTLYSVDYLQRIYKYVP